MDKSFTERASIQLTLIIVLVMGIISAASLLLRPPSLAATDEQSLQGRYPASIEKSGYKPHLAQETELTQVIKLSCLEDDLGEKLVTKARQIRIRGGVCIDLKEPLKTTVLNTSNGYSASVFRTSDGLYTTDYIQLSPGQNRIQIMVVLEGGEQHMSEIIIAR